MAFLFSSQWKVGRAWEAVCILTRMRWVSGPRELDRYTLVIEGQSLEVICLYLKLSKCEQLAGQRSHWWQSEEVCIETVLRLESMEGQRFTYASQVLAMDSSEGKRAWAICRNKVIPPERVWREPLRVTDCPGKVPQQGAEAEGPQKEIFKEPKKEPCKAFIHWPCPGGTDGDYRML